MHEGKVTQIEKREKIRPEESRRHEALVPNQTEKPTLNGRPS
jgi:hypothetical protein